MINEKLNKDILDLINENKSEIDNLKPKILWKIIIQQVILLHKMLIY